MELIVTPGRHCYVDLADGTFVNAELVREGWAQVATFPPDVTKEAEIRAAPLRLARRCAFMP